MDDVVEQVLGEKPDTRIVSGDFWGDDPHRGLTWLREHDPVHWDPVGEIWGVSKYSDVREVSRHPEIYSSAGGFRPDVSGFPMMIEMDDPAHWRRRKLLNKGFTPRRVQDQRARIEQISQALVDRVCERGECDFVWDVAAWLPLIVIGDMIGARPENHRDLLRWSDDMMRGQGQPDNAEAIEKMTTAALEYNEYFTGVLADRRACPRDDLLSILAHAEVDGDRLDDESMLYESLLLLIGGDETTRHVITGGLYQLLADRDNWERLRADRGLLPTAVEEMLRWVSPIRNMSRTVTQDTTLRGKELRAGEKVLMLYPSANRDEEVFADPFRFDITRSPNDHLAFGLGTHFCLGNSLARLELNVIFETLLDRLPDLDLVVPEEPALRPANFVSGYESLKITFTPVKPVGVNL
ncbi:cytochrome P450 [Frankia sp. CNm7]|uniref:Cytochrome P450 n=2 Tax=Frankia nepalensis TaxID=1836974 RepID=A0A937RFD2_9ACTN|nr:cytochrome P450 [Frankia nepalensis]MBL7510018.1 cytochrome P450 [Frankia nepalensis]MBL7517130.1 cytochrome P450 [Frankia nepalensis]MBL7627970.1 cytochrome P450 [Frankia nepalensis]